MELPAPLRGSGEVGARFPGLAPPAKVRPALRASGSPGPAGAGGAGPTRHGRRLAWVSALVVLAAAAPAPGTETENLGLRALPAPGAVRVDGQADDWDLTGGVFVCGDVEGRRETLSLWLHLMYDARTLYVLARWNDPTPLNNPGQTTGDHGFQGDCLQFRTITAYRTDAERAAHLTCWKGRDGRDVIDVTYGRKFKQGHVPDAKEQGARQAFGPHVPAAAGDKGAAKGKGYTQEIAVPWRLLCRPGQTPKAGGQIVFTVEPNYTTPAGGRLTDKGIFRAGKAPDRVFTFMAADTWGVASLARTGKVAPQTLRLSDRRELRVRIAGGVPVVDWHGLARREGPRGFEEIAFEMPADGYVSMIVRDAAGKVVRHLLSCQAFAKGRHVVRWDGLTTPIWKTPGQCVPAGTYTWEAIRHGGIGLRLRGWACNAGSAPWDGPTGRENWGGDHGAPVSAATDGRRVLLGWSGAEAGKALVACDLDGRVQWRHTRGGMGGAGSVAVDGGIVYVIDHGKVLYRLTAETGSYSAWAGTKSTDLTLAGLWDGSPETFGALEACGGRLYLGSRASRALAVLDGATGKLLRKVAVPNAIDIEAAGGRVCVLSAAGAIVEIDPATWKTRTLVTGLEAAHGLAIDGEGRFFAGLRGKARQVRVLDAGGKVLRTIGRRGGRAATGPWMPDGMRNVAGMVVDARGRLWVMEATKTPARVSVWDAATGRLVREMFGPTHYGASGACISPRDPNVMVGEGCEWRIDPKTARARCTGVFEQSIASSARFCTGANGRLYVVTNHSRGGGDLRIHERLGEGRYALRARLAEETRTISPDAPPGGGKKPRPRQEKLWVVWADADGDGRRQAGEVREVRRRFGFAG